MTRYSMIFRIFTLLTTLSVSFLSAEESFGDLIFTDDFERNETQEEREEIGQGWASNSKKRANGNKQVDLKDGTMRIKFHPSADHAVSVTHPAEFTDGTIGLRFKLENPSDSLGLNFADLKYKKVHAGHLFVVKISTKAVQISDLKTGNMDLEIREARKANTLTATQKQVLKTKSVTKKHQLETNHWYHLLVTIEGDKLSVLIDGTEVSSFQSEGIAHPTKRTLRLAVPKEAVVDDVKIWRRS